jgi:hypothetical protein
MSVAAASLVASTSLSVPDHIRLRRFRLHSRPPLHSPQLNRFHRQSLCPLVRAVLEDRAPPPPAEEDAKRYGLNGNGSGLGYEDAAVEAYLGSNGNGSASSIRSENGAAVKPAASATGSSVALVPVQPVDEERKTRKERVEEIGREDAWFKQGSGQGPLPEVSFVCLASAYVIQSHFHVSFACFD